MDKRTLLSLTTDIVSSHASINELRKEDLLAEIHNVFAKLSALSGDVSVPSVPMEGEVTTEGEAPMAPAVPLEAAFGAEKVFCMVCGKGMKTLKRHLSTSHDLKPGQYRKQFDIPAGTPLVAKNYSEARKKMAKDLNLAEGLAKARAARGKKPEPAVPAESAFGPEKVFCMVCGKGLKSLKRHLSTAHDMSPAKYCEMFGIPADTPLDAKAYSQA